MNAEQLKTIFQKIVQEAADKIREDFDALPATMDATAALHQVLDANLDVHFHVRLFNAATQFAGTPQPEYVDRIHAHVEQVTFPSGKDIKISLSIPSSFEKRVECTGLHGQNVVIQAEQMRIPDDLPQEEEADAVEEEQQELPIDVPSNFGAVEQE